MVKLRLETPVEMVTGTDEEAPMEAFALLLGGGIQNLPTIVRGAQVPPGKPALIPDMEIPAAERKGQGGLW